VHTESIRRDKLATKKTYDTLEERITRLEALLENGIKADISEIKSSINEINNRLNIYLEKTAKLETSSKIMQGIYISGILLVILTALLLKLL